MVLNEKKTKNIIFNFSKTKQFTTDLRLKNVSLEVVNETKLLGVYITNDLKWNKNTEVLVKDANRRMRILHKAANFVWEISSLRWKIIHPDGPSSDDFSSANANQIALSESDL